MTLTKINQTELFDAMIERLPLRPSDGGGEGRAPMTGEQIREAFDRAPKLIAASLDRLIDELSGGALATLPIGEGEEALSSRLSRLGAATDEAKADLASALSALEGLRTRIEAIEGGSLDIDFSPYATKSEIAEGLSLILAALGEEEAS